MSARKAAANTKLWSKVALWPTRTARLQSWAFTALRIGENISLRPSRSGTASRSGFQGSMPVKSRADCSRLAPSKGSICCTWVSPRRSKPSSSMVSMTAAISSRASRSGLKPAVSTSTTTGRKPRKRWDIGCGGLFSSDTRTPMFALGMNSELRHAPVNGFTSLERDDGAIRQWKLLRHGPGLPHQGNGIGVAWQAVEVRAVEAGKGFQFVQNAQFLKDVCVQADGAVGRVATGAAAGGFLFVPGVGRRIGTQEEARIAAGNRLAQGQLMLVAFQDRQAIQVGTDTAHQHVVAVVHQVLGRQGGGQVAAGVGAHKLGGVRRGDVLQDHFQGREGLDGWAQDPFQKHFFPVEDINVGIRDFAVNQKQHAALSHGFKHRVNIADIGNTRF